MFEKCANPACNACWGNSHLGRIFLSDSAPFLYTTRTLQVRVGSRPRAMHCFWLCDRSPLETIQAGESYQFYV